jgi:hypothetical protein
MKESKYSKHIVQELKTDRFTPEYNAKYATFATRVMWMDNKIVDGAFQMNCSWYLGPNPPDMPERNSHTHASDEIIGFFGSNHKDPYDLGGEIEFWIEDEKFMLTKTSLIFIPGGLAHCPLVIHRVDRPIFHFSTVTAGQYDFNKKE